MSDREELYDDGPIECTCEADFDRGRIFACPVHREQEPEPGSSPVATEQRRLRQEYREHKGDPTPNECCGFTSNDGLIERCSALPRFELRQLAINSDRFREAKTCPRHLASLIVHWSGGPHPRPPILVRDLRS